jgi:hypothetical protein
MFHIGRLQVALLVGGGRLASRRARERTPDESRAYDDEPGGRERPMSVGGNFRDREVLMSAAIDERAAGVDARSAAAMALRPLTERAVRRALAGDHAAPLDGDDVQALRAVSEEARERGLGAEHLVLVLKTLWRELPDAHRLPHDEARAALARLVTLGIETFYPPCAARHAAPPVTPRDGGGL